MIDAQMMNAGMAMISQFAIIVLLATTVALVYVVMTSNGEQ